MHGLSSHDETFPTFLLELPDTVQRMAKNHGFCPLVYLIGAAAPMSNIRDWDWGTWRGFCQVNGGKVEWASSSCEEPIRRARRPVGVVRLAATRRASPKCSTARRVTTS